MTLNPLLAGLAPTHPGQILATAIEGVNKPKAEIARLLQVSRQTLYDLLDGKQAVSAPIALRIGKLFGNGPDIWLRLQANYDLRKARDEIGSTLDTIPTLEAVG